MLVNNQVLLLLPPLLINQSPHHYLSFLLLPYRPRCSPQSQHFLLHISFSCEKDFPALTRVVPVYLPEYHRLVLSDVHLCTCSPRSVCTQSLCRDRANAGLSHVQAPRWQNIINSSLMMEHEVSDQYCHQPGDLNMPHEQEDYKFYNEGLYRDYANSRSFYQTKFGRLGRRTTA